MNLKIVMVLLALYPMVVNGLGQDDQTSEQSELENFRLEAGLQLASLANASTTEFLQIVEDQKLEIAEIRKEFSLKADEIRKSPNLAPKDQLEKLRDLRGQLDKKLRGVLLPHQKKLLAAHNHYNCVIQEGLVNSMVRGAIARHFKLSIDERRTIKVAAQRIWKEYSDNQNKTQKRAIAKLIDSFPEEKQSQFKDMLEPMLYHDGLLFIDGDLNFNTDVGLNIEPVLGGLPPIDDK